MAHHAVQLHRGATATRPEPSTEPPEAHLFAHMPGTPEEWIWRGNRVHYRVLGDGPPLVLVHSPDVGGSCLEWRRVMEPLSADFHVIAVDLPGFGLSDARPISYGADLYMAFLADFIKHAAGAACAIGSGLGASYLAHIGVRLPELLIRLVLVAPSGVNGCRTSPFGGMKYQLIGLPGLNQAVCGAGATRYSILEYLQRVVYADDQAAGNQAVDARYWVSHKPNAQCVERSRMAGLMHTDIRPAIKKLTQPTALFWGRQATRPPVADAESFKEMRPQTGLVVFERSSLAPHEEEPSRFAQASRTFLCADAWQAR